jgi:8-oxo-dGTP pyrophosphatase MutT (NUDIX family)
VSLHDDAVLTLTAWQAPSAPDEPAQEKLRQAYLDHLAAHADGMWKACRTGHITASALVIAPESGRVLLTLHRKLRMWLQMGGHCEPQDASLEATALREATEESGIQGLTLLPGGPVRLDRHHTPCAWHLDVEYAALAPPGAVETISDESLDLRWFEDGQVAQVADDSVVRLVTATRKRLAA